MLEFRLFHDGDVWVAERGTLRASGETLEALDRALETRLQTLEGLAGSGKQRVRMTFDNKTIPQWIRQYSNHYFNRVVIINL